MHGVEVCGRVFATTCLTVMGMKGAWQVVTLKRLYWGAISGSFLGRRPGMRCEMTLIVGLTVGESVWVSTGVWIPWLRRNFGA
ncbi:hypothetical protein BDV98DRAFT_556941 [Pterulicium gracile]|uniref:Uncharacterized protein n=1 Tax=Pterulicium gracile TaxID=1884261 RepID=A0A5C3R017_9AGAR|nr:hypothetical protein BDV98DRAFT_556941 [Pterula gracilis]